MEYHEIGDMFVHNGVILEVVRCNNNACKDCYFYGLNNCLKNCTASERRDGINIIYSLIYKQDIDEVRSKMIHSPLDFFSKREIALLNAMSELKKMKNDMEQEKQDYADVFGNVVATSVTNSDNNNTEHDNVNHPRHYTNHPSGIECIQITRHYNFCIGNAIKYLWRQGLKTEEGMSDTDKQIEDLKKAVWYINDEIKRLKGLKTEKQ